MNFINQERPIYRLRWKGLNYDLPLLGLLCLLLAFGLIILYSASNENPQMLFRQSLRLGFAFIILSILAYIPPHKYKSWTPGLYFFGLSMLIAVMLIGKIGKGAQRWLDLGFFRFQPSEIMKLAVPMMTAWYLSKIQSALKLKHILVAGCIIFTPALLIVKQPDLGTAIMVVTAGLSVLFLAGLSFRLIIFTLISVCVAIPFLWHHLHDYQRKRIFTLLSPEKDPLGAGYHIIQSKIAIGSGGFSGKGWLQGSQSHLNFLPEHATDFIFAVNGEEFGFIGGVIIILLIGLIAIRSLYIAYQAQTTYTRLLAASLAISFFLSGFVNIGMVMGILPVVGVPLPLVSYGGTAMVTFLASFGIIMSIGSHRIMFRSL